MGHGQIGRFAAIGHLYRMLTFLTSFPRGATRRIV